MLKHNDRRSTRRWAKIGPPLRGRTRKPAGFVATLARGPKGPRCAPLLSSGLPDAIRAIRNGRKVLSGPHHIRARSDTPK
jgi:hypothetical protein